jgi:hypothetical protein
MTGKIALGAAAVVLASGGLISAQQTTGSHLPFVPPQQSGLSVTPAFEGWWSNPDGTHSFLIGYFNRNTEADVDVPIGPNNKFEPGNPDLGQPTHFLPKRQFGMFVVNVPKEFAPPQKLTWTLTVAGNTVSIPFYMHVNYEISAFKSTEEGPDKKYNTPPALRFVEGGPAMVGPIGTPLKAIERKATVGTPMPLEMFTEDDGVYTTGSNAPLLGGRTPVTWSITKYRGPGTVKAASDPKVTGTKGGKPNEPFAGKGSTTVTFSQPGDYMLHVQLNDFSGQGGRGTGCCWTTAIIKVQVSGTTNTGGQ